MWPDGEIKSSPNFWQSCPNIPHNSFYENVMLSIKGKNLLYIWVTLTIKFATKNFQNGPIWSHWQQLNHSNGMLTYMSIMNRFSTVLIFNFNWLWAENFRKWCNNEIMKSHWLQIVMVIRTNNNISSLQCSDVRLRKNLLMTCLSSSTLPANSII